MAVLGKSLAFYLKYWTEMKRLCESEEGKLEGLPEAEKTIEMAQAVGSKANRQAADLLETCAVDLESHFHKIAKCQRRTSRKIVEKNWAISYGIWITKKPAKYKLQVGIDIVRLEKPEIVPWMWLFGGKEAEETLVQILKGRVKAKSQDLGWSRWSAGTVALDRIPIFPDNLDGFDIDREPLVAKIGESFKAVSPDDLMFLFKLAV